MGLGVSYVYSYDTNFGHKPDCLYTLIFSQSGLIVNIVFFTFFSFVTTTFPDLAVVCTPLADISRLSRF